MLKVNLKFIFLYFLVSAYTVIVSIILVDKLGNIYTEIVNPLSWLFMFLISLYLTWNSSKRIKGKKDKVQTVFIIILFYLIIYFISGLFFDYSISTLSHKPIYILKNLWTFFVIIIFKEHVRFSLLNNNSKSKLFVALVILLFILVDINFLNFEKNFISGESIFKYVSTTIVPVIAQNLLFTFLSIKCGYESVLAYRLPIMFANILLPILPKLDWFVSSLFDLALCFITFMCINYLYTKKYLDRKERISKRNVRKQNPIRYIPFMLVLLLFVGFVAGFFKYMPLAIMSNSMANLINRGDIVIINKLKDEEKKELQVYDIIEYELDGSMIVHRIVDIETDNSGNRIYTTKGDNNNTIDNKKVLEKDVKAKVKFKIPLIGYPIVWLNDLFNNTAPDVELGK